MVTSGQVVGWGWRLVMEVIAELGFYASLAVDPVGKKGTHHLCDVFARP